jgi:hypothetical protein
MQQLKVTAAVMKKISINRLRNDMPEANKDKRAMNIPLLILDIMMRLQLGEHLQSKKEDILISHIENLSKYRSRHLHKEEETFRTDIIIALIQLLPKYNFTHSSLQAEADELYIRFQEKPFDILAQPYEVEVINYEVTWIYITNFLQGKYFDKVAIIEG